MIKIITNYGSLAQEVFPDDPRPPTPLGTPVYDMLLTLITTTEIYACVIGREHSPADKGY